MKKARNLDTKCETLPVTSSTPIELPAEQERLFQEILSLLEEEEFPFAVSGAFAFQEHTGICRSTKDLDIFMSPQATTRALGTLRDLGFECEVTDPVWLAKARRGNYFVDLIAGMSTGTMTVDESWIERSRTAKVLGVKTRVLAPEELIASKLFVTRRERFDGADIAHLIYATQGSLHWDRILELAGEHWELVLWQLVLYRYVYPMAAHYVPPEVWEGLLERFSSEVNSWRPNGQFRGSLIDPLMFAIDVEEWGLHDVLKEYQERSPKIQLLPRPRLRRMK